MDTAKRLAGEKKKQRFQFENNTQKDDRLMNISAYF